VLGNWPAEFVTSGVGTEHRVVSLVVKCSVNDELAVRFTWIVYVHALPEPPYTWYVREVCAEPNTGGYGNEYVAKLLAGSAAPATISRSSVVIAVWRALFISTVYASMSLPAFSVALFIAMSCAAKNAASVSSIAAKMVNSTYLGKRRESTASGEGSNSTAPRGPLESAVACSCAATGSSTRRSGRCESIETSFELTSITPPILPSIKSALTRAVLFSALPHVADLTRRVNLIQQRVAEPLVVDGRSIYTSASIGVAPLGPRYLRAEDVLRDADTAMYRAKADGRARAALFDHAMHEGAMRRLQLASDLREALDRAELRLAYQPIVRLSDGRTIGYEALMRWEHPRDGLLLPDDFIPLAEETGLIIGLGRWMMDEACRRLSHLQQADASIAMHLNLSVQEVMRGDTAAYLDGCILRHGLRATSVIVEITENAIIESTRSSDASLRNLRELGVGVCIDDFGVGYSSLRYLHRFPISGLKIDRSFVTGSDDDLASEPIVRMLLELARTLGLDVVAEGIESERQSAALQILGCLYGQGYLYAVPEIGLTEYDRTAAPT